mgnify:CR=1 FL=1
MPESASELAHRVAILEEESRGLRLQNEALRTDLSQANDELEWRRALADDGGAAVNFAAHASVVGADGGGTLHLELGLQTEFCAEDGSTTERALPAPIITQVATGEDALSLLTSQAGHA